MQNPTTCPSPLLPIILTFLLIITPITVCLTIWIYLYRIRTTFHIHNRTVVIFGGASGLGRELVKQCSAKGASKVIMADIMSNDANLGTELASTNYLFVPNCDVSQHVHVQTIFNTIKHDNPSLIINCAGIVSGLTLHELSLEQFQHVVNVNLIGNFNVAKVFLPHLQANNDGMLVSVSSMMGLLGGSHLSDYCATKFAIVGMFEALRLELSTFRGISLLVVCPYAFSSSMFDGIFEGTRWNRTIRTLFPLLDLSYTASATLRAIERRQTLAVIPDYFSPLINIVRALPTPLYEAVLSGMGGKDGMLHFRGKKHAS